jgi:CRISPR/Cas system-associated exonuclease Cas4 (RecB family)
MRTIRASEIGAYIYCKRAWWYQQKGLTSENQAEFASGSQMHTQHGKRVFFAGVVRLAAYAAFLGALLLLVIGLFSSIL